MDAPQIELFSSKPPATRIVLAVETNIAPFGNRTDVIVVDEGTVRGMSLLECTDPDVEYFNMHSSLDEEYDNE